MKDFLSEIIIQSPNIGSLTFSAQIFYQLVDDIRARSYRGLRVGEEEIQKAGHLMQGKTDLSKKDFEISIGEVVKNFVTAIGKQHGLGFGQPRRP